MPEVIYERAPELKRDASALIDEYHQHLLDAEIIYMWRIGHWCVKGLAQHGKTMIVPQLWREVSGYDLAVVVNKTAYIHQTENDRRAMLDNLLCQFGLTAGGNFQTRDHDIKEFSEAVRRNSRCMSNLPAIGAATAEIKKLDVPDEPEESEIIEIGIEDDDEEETLFAIEDMEDIDDAGCTVTSLVSFEK